MAFQRLGLAGFDLGLEQLAGLPRWYLVFAAVTAGIVEETLFRGYALERLSAILGSDVIAGMLTAAVFALVHVPFWGWEPLPVF